MNQGPGVALLVGAGDAIGAAVARRFAAAGYKVCIARRDASKSSALIDELTKARVQAKSMDVRKEADVQALFAVVEQEMGPIELCLFNAGANVSKPILETSERLFYKAWELACYGGFLVGREAAKYMTPRSKGTILFTGATASLRGGKNFAAFASAKFGLRAVAQSAARELGPRNIHVAHLIIDGGLDSPEIHRRLVERGVDVAGMAPDALIKPSSVAEAYWCLHQQPRDAWTHELDLRPFAEGW
ncbi:NAD(P)-dependent dehydrogenase (short-subunit alcohol dehydrogenase family) [Bradyrhizobium sp. USDA 4516]